MSTTPPNSAPGDARPDKPSHAAEYVAALYVALLLLTPWLLRDASFFAPPSRGVEIQVVDRAIASRAALGARPAPAAEPAAAAARR